MRLTADLINQSLSYINTLKERELDLRGHKLPSIENLGVARDQDCIDFTDNDIVSLSGFPLSPRLKTLLCARNRIAGIQPNLAKSIPNLSTLVLTHNQIVELADLDALASFPRLTHLVVMENPVSSKENYRYWVIWRCPSVRFLDFVKVRDVERKKAKELFGTAAAPSDAAQKIISIRANRPASLIASSASPTANGTAAKGFRMKLTENEKKRVEELIRNTKSLAEIAQLEKQLNEGKLPSGILRDDEMDTT
ncbi:U2 snRNP complex subunit [Elasticomyces elasticus]|nr:U2 snRNP complex subunit [Elasticomyces elasticus]KAK4994002.1 U2 snRNP complex subunit [Elasticomyces elasticus]